MPTLSPHRILVTVVLMATRCHLADVGTVVKAGPILHPRFLELFVREALNSLCQADYRPPVSGAPISLAGKELEFSTKALFYVCVFTSRGGFHLTETAAGG